MGAVQDHKAFPKITEVALKVAYDHGAINRFEPESEFLERLDGAIGADGVYWEDMAALEAWLCTLTDEQIDTLASGDEDEMKIIEQSSPKFQGDPDISTCEIFNAVLDL